jgi:RNA polymerase sigma-70 factor (ECF subfamily)
MILSQYFWRRIVDISDDSLLVAQSKNGDKSAFGKLFNKYRNRLIKHVGRLLSCKADAEDVVQEAFLRAFRGISSFKEESSFFTWIFKISINCAYSSARLTNQSAAVSIIYMSHPDDWDSHGVMAGCADNPADEYQRGQLLSEIDKQLNCMDHIFSETFILRELDGLNYDEIAEATRCSVGTVRSRLFRARHLINAVLTKR